VFTQRPKGCKHAQKEETRQNIHKNKEEKGILCRLDNSLIGAIISTFMRREKIYRQIKNLEHD
jgi:hypothetical protein